MGRPNRRAAWILLGAAAIGGAWAFLGPLHLVSSSGELNRELYFAEQAGQTAKAFDVLTVLARRGDSDAQAILGSYYQLGAGVTRDDDKAAYWYRRAISQGSAMARYRLATMAINGRASFDGHEAAQAIRDYADSYANADACADYGMLLLLGRFVPADAVGAIEWFRRSAEAGNSRGQYLLARAYFRGEGIQKDDVEAYRWARVAAEKGFPMAMTLAARLLHAGVGVMTDRDAALTWLTKAAQAGDPEGQTELAKVRLLEGEGSSESLRAAAVLLEMAAKQGWAEAHKLLGMVLAQTPDLPQAWLHLSIAAETEALPTESASLRSELEAEMSPKDRAAGAALLDDWRKSGVTLQSGFRPGIGPGG